MPVEWAGKALFGLPGVAAGLAVTTVLVLGALLAALSLDTLAARRDRAEPCRRC